jgi:predicted nucleic acid-binding protein
MKPLLLDTNILLRFITGEPADQAKESAELVAAAEAGKVRLVVLPMVLAEAVFVLTGFYEHPRSKVAEVLSHLISSPGFQNDEPERMLHALRLFGAGKLDFVDCYLAAASIREGRTLVSFDRDLAKLHGIKVCKPGDCL